MKVGGQYYFYQNDHLGAPQKLSAVNGAVVWSAKYSSFGEANVDLSSIVTNNLRLSGQYFDDETGLHYNYYRFYDPSLGRYICEDPDGLIGGINLFAYVLNNPFSRIDPYGLYDSKPLSPPTPPGIFPPTVERDLERYFQRIRDRIRRIGDKIKDTLEDLVPKVRQVACQANRTYFLKFSGTFYCNSEWHMDYNNCRDENILYSKNCFDNAKAKNEECLKTVEKNYERCIKKCKCD